MIEKMKGLNKNLRSVNKFKKDRIISVEIRLKKKYLADLKLISTSRMIKLRKIRRKCWIRFKFIKLKNRKWCLRVKNLKVVRIHI